MQQAGNPVAEIGTRPIGGGAEASATAQSLWMAEIVEVMIPPNSVVGRVRRYRNQSQRSPTVPDAA